MIYLVSTVWTGEPTQRWRGSLDRALEKRATQISYEELFFTARGPLGHYIFTDLDRLSRYELDAVGAFARALARTEPRVRILNFPAGVVHDRASLLLALHAAGINDFTVARLQYGERPGTFPVFIRAADGHQGAETDLIESDDAFTRAIDEMRARGAALSGRLAVGFAAARSPDGFFRKYGVVNVGGRLIPQHVMRGRTWMVKNRDNQISDESAREEMAFIRENPHRECLARVFALAGVEFGRADYGLVGGRPQIYEINTNPHLPRFEKRDGRSPRRAIIREQLIAAFQEIDRPLGRRGWVRFEMPRPQAHPLRLPVSRFGVRLAPHVVRFLTQWARRKLAGSHA